MKKIREAKIEDIPAVMICINDAKSFLKKSGSTQWNNDDGYPSDNDIKEDIKNKRLYVEEIDGEIAGCCAFLGVEPEYSENYGSWLTDSDNYLTIHRVAVSDKFRGKKVAKDLFNYANIYAKNNHLDSIRVDTHPKNLIMQHLAISLGFTECGYVIYSSIPDEPKRIVYEKIVK